MGIKLHYHPLSTYSRRVRIAFAEKQIPHELVVVEMASPRQGQLSHRPSLSVSGSSIGSPTAFPSSSSSAPRLGSRV